MRKPHANSRLKTLPEETMERIAAWCAEGSLDSVVQRCASELQPPVETNRTSVSEFCQWWKLRQTFAQANAEAEQAVELLRTEFPDATPEKIAAAGQLIFTLRAQNAKKVEEFVLLEQLRLSQQIATSNAAIAQAKLDQKERQLTQKDEDLQLARARFRRDTAELFLEWYDKEEAKKIASGSGTNAEKIEALGRAMFGDDWEDQA